MKLVVGLGNPGSRYAATRHNVGFRVLEQFAREHRISLAEARFAGAFGHGALSRGARSGRALANESDTAPFEVGLLAPTTFMNRSGEAVLAALSELPIENPEDLWVVFDDVDLPFGRLRLRGGGGSGGHRGLGHIIECLGRQDFPRLRFGVGRPEDPAQETAEHVLLPFSADEEIALPALLEHAAEALELALRDGAAVAMDRFNRDPETATANDG